MKPIILRRNASPVYSFLSLMNDVNEEDSLAGKKILDCGAGGVLPPLSLFAPFGMTLFGIDPSEAQLEKAEAFLKKNAIEAVLQKGDMRELPFEDETFEFVYEHYSMCHLSHADTQRAIEEMKRVLKPGGLCFLGMISSDCEPKETFGEEREKGHFWGEEGGELTLHSLFEDGQADAMVAGWEVMAKEKRIQFYEDDSFTYAHIYYTLRKE
jgi:SAM-dependent methyltransferase